MRLAAGVSPAAGWTYAEIRDLALQAEAAGLPTFWVSDHFFAGAGDPERNCLEAWTLIAALARDTTTLRLGTLVTAHSYRNPAYLAKLVASVDHLSDGRVEFGIGAGWKENEYAAYGYEFPPPGVRVSQLRDTLEIVKRMWVEDRATYEGRHYSVREAVCAPKPAQRPHPPIWIGGVKPRIMRLAARHADGFNIGRGAVSDTPIVDRLRPALAALDEACSSVGRTQPLHVSHWTPVEVRDERGAMALLKEARDLEALGLAEYQLMFPRDGARDMLHRVVHEVLPAL